MTRRLLTLLGIAVICVVLFHSTVYGFNSLFFWTNRYADVSVPNFDQYGTPTYYSLLFIRRAVAFGVGVFLFVSGYFVAFATGRKNETIEWKVIWTRILYLLIPYFIWSTVIFTGKALAYGQILSPMEYVRRFLLGQATTAYYYVPLICQLYVVSRFMVPLAKKHWKLFLVTTAVIQFAVQALRYFSLLDISNPTIDTLIRLTPIWFFPIRIFWFALGLVIGFHFKQFKEFLMRTRWVFLVATILLLIASLVEFETLLHLTNMDWRRVASFSPISSTLYGISFIFTFLAFDKLSRPLPAELSDIGTKSYGVYLLTDQVLDLTGTLMYRFTPWVLGNQLLYQIVMVAAGLGIPLLLMNRISKSPARRMYRYLFG